MRQPAAASFKMPDLPATVGLKSPYRSHNYTPLWGHWTRADRLHQLHGDLVGVPAPVPAVTYKTLRAEYTQRHNRAPHLASHPELPGALVRRVLPRVITGGIKKGLCRLAEPLFVLVAGVGFEPTTFRL